MTPIHRVGMLYTRTCGGECMYTRRQMHSSSSRSGLSKCKCLLYSAQPRQERGMRIMYSRPSEANISIQPGRATASARDPLCSRCLYPRGHCNETWRWFSHRGVSGAAGGRAIEKVYAGPFWPWPNLYIIYSLRPQIDDASRGHTWNSPFCQSDNNNL